MTSSATDTSVSDTIGDDPFFKTLSLLKTLIKNQNDSNEICSSARLHDEKDRASTNDTTIVELKEQLEYYEKSLENEKKQRESMEKALDELSIHMKLLQNQRNQLEKQLKRRSGGSFIDRKEEVASLQKKILDLEEQAKVTLMEFEKLRLEHESTKRELEIPQKDLFDTRLNESTADGTPNETIQVMQTEILSLRTENSQLKANIQKFNIEIDEYKKKLILLESHHDDSIPIDHDNDGKIPAVASSSHDTNAEIEIIHLSSEKEHLQNEIKFLRCALRRAMGDARHSQILLESVDDRLCGREHNLDIFKMMSENDVEKLNVEISHIRCQKTITTSNQSSSIGNIESNINPNNNEKYNDTVKLLELHKVLVKVLQSKIKKFETERMEAGQNMEHLLLDLDQKNDEIQSLHGRVQVLEQQVNEYGDNFSAKELVADPENNNINNEIEDKMDAEKEVYHTESIDTRVHADKEIANNLVSEVAVKDINDADEKDEPSTKKQKTFS